MEKGKKLMEKSVYHFRLNSRPYSTPEKRKLSSRKYESKVVLWRGERGIGPTWCAQLVDVQVP